MLLICLRLVSHGFGGEPAESGFGGAGGLGVEEAGGVLRGQGEGEVAEACVPVPPEAAVSPNRARTSTTRPSGVVAASRALARTCGCQRLRTWRDHARREVGAGGV